ncbi:hypothetical protein [Sphingomonas alba]|uniref:Uncharacterized protein n=1 Tax=Sphingomonas alba TaxID=2908208 RepID=A0ABT0RJV1_9SPHN|nr:hypothetical protein [Sphingomonas alba]MCL6682886.1 hypothetical protein [Sphingomonas alba]
MNDVKNLLSHTSFLTHLPWKWVQAREISEATVSWETGLEDSCEAVRVEDLDPEWINALASADYSHLPELKKQPA